MHAFTLLQALAKAAIEHNPAIAQVLVLARARSPWCAHGTYWLHQALPCLASRCMQGLGPLALIDAPKRAGFRVVGR